MVLFPSSDKQDTKENLLFWDVVWQMLTNVLKNYTTCILFYNGGDSMFLLNTGEVYQITWHHIPEDSNLHSQHHENLKSHKTHLLGPLVELTVEE
jgi:hypothetical protein